MRYAGNIACIAEMRNTYKILVDKAWGKSSLARPPRHGWEDNIRQILKKQDVRVWVGLTRFSIQPSSMLV
jgi:hypothetical protein